MPCIWVKSQAHKYTQYAHIHIPKKKEERDLKKEIFPSKAKSPAKRPVVSMCVQGVWGEKKEGEGRLLNGY